MADTDWKPFYKELIGIVQSYRYDRTGLLSKLKEIMDKSTENEYEKEKKKWEEKHLAKNFDKDLVYGKNYPILGKDSSGKSIIKLGDSQITDIDPFTFLCCMNNGKNDIKSHGIAAHDVFNMNNPYPSDFDFGIPIIPGEVKCFVWYEENGNLNDYKNRIEYCWELFDCVFKFIDDPASYNNQFASLLTKFHDMTYKRIGSATIMFFLMSPENFISLDEHTKNFIKDPENDFSNDVIDYLDGFSNSSNEFNLEYYLNFCKLLKSELTSFDDEMDFKKLVYRSYSKAENDAGNWNKKAPRERISSFFKSDRFNGAYLDLDVRQKGGNCTFGTRSVDNRYYWLNPRNELLNDTWYVILHDDIKHIIYLFKVPAGSIDPNIIHDHSTYVGKKNMRIDYKDKDFPDHECENKVKLVDYLKETISYSVNTVQKQKEPEHNNFVGTNKIYYGIPGSGKSQKIKDEITDRVGSKYYTRILFHPDYTYSDFVGQILPKRNGEKIEYDFVSGPFTNILKAALNDKKNMYYLIIEEINRGNAPAIFGDIFQLLDRDENSESTYSIINADISYEIYKSAKGETEEQKKAHEIKIPSNLTIIATMNTSDQNVFTLDTAFKRRWEMEYVEDAFKADDYSNELRGAKIPNSIVTWEKFHDVINEVITSSPHQVVSTEDKRLGCYFATLKELSSLDSFTNKIIRYIWDDVSKTNRNIFKSDIKTFDDIYEKRNNEDFIRSIFSDDIANKLEN